MTEPLRALVAIAVLLLLVVLAVVVYHGSSTSPGHGLRCQSGLVPDGSGGCSRL